VAANHAAFHGYPDAVVEYSLASAAVTATRSSADGILRFTSFNAGLGSATLMNATPRFYLTPANFYVGAATIEQGSPLQPTVGRSVQPDVVNWRLSNGLVRVTPNATPGKIDIAHWKGAAWAAAKTYKITASGLVNGWTAVTVLRNSTEECVLRLSCTTTGDVIPTYLDISLRRGDRLVRMNLSIQWNTANFAAVYRDATEAATAITYGAVTLGGIRATANDADGNRYVLLSYQGGTTNDLVFGGLTLTAGQKTMDIGIGSEIGGSGAAAIDTATAIANQYLAAQAESQRIVSR
jgi:hypothetical protein